MFSIHIFTMKICFKHIFKSAGPQGGPLIVCVFKAESANDKPE